MNRFRIALIVLLLGVSHFAFAATRPNIVLIMPDDMGYSDLGSYGGEIETPNIDRLAAEGARFREFYNASICGPTRAALLTGLYNHQTGVHTWNGVRNNRCVNIGEALRRAGYRTMMVGKWTDTESPVHKGFDRAYGHLAQKGPGNYFKLVNTAQHFLDGDPYTLPEDYFKTDANTDHAVEFLREAAPMDQPFFLYVAYSAPHWPLHAREADIAKYRQRYRDLGWDACREQRLARQKELGLFGDTPPAPRDPAVGPWADAPHKDWEAERMAVYAAQIDCMDRNIGRILDTIREIGREENTVVMFLSDNGATERNPGATGVNPDGSFYLDKPGKTWRIDGTLTKPLVPGVMPGPADTFGGYGAEWAHVSNAPLRDYKATNYEGGILTPFIVKWPGAIANPGAILDPVGHVIDVMPTCLELAGATYPESYPDRDLLPLEGQSLVPALRGMPWKRSEPLFWEYGGHRAARDGDWKIVAKTGAPWELYNLRQDRAEQHDRAAEDPERVRDLASHYADWAARCGAKP